MPPSWPPLLHRRRARPAAALAFAALLWGCGAPTETVPAPEGQWGSKDASLELTRAGGQITYPCAYGTIDSTWTLAADGRFSGTGKHYGGGGPQPIQGREPSDATYSGQFRGKVLTLRVTLPSQGGAFGPFTLVRGVTGTGPVCLAAQ